jgi:DNA-binding NarL/FixJ family response regulator
METSVKTTVLIADDHPVMREGLRALLAGEPDIDVIAVCGNAREAIARARALVPNIVLMDISMPDLNGIEATRELRRIGVDAAVVMLSMHSTSQHVYAALEAGAAGYILKERAGGEIVTAVRAVARGHRRYLSSGLKDPSDAPGRDGSPIARLSRRERQVLELVVAGRTSVEIAELVHLSPKSIDTYRSRIMAKLGISDVASLVKFALRHGLTSLD